MNQLTETKANELQTQGGAAMDALGQPSGGVDIWGIVSRRKWLLIFGFLMGLVIGYVYLLRADPVFQSQAQVLIQTDRAAMPLVSELGGVEYQSQGSNHDLIIRSPVQIVKAYEKVKDLETFKQDGAKALAQNLEVLAIDDQATIFSISFEGPDPDDAQKAVEAVVNSYQEFLSDTYQSDGQKAVRFFNEAQNDLDKRMQVLQDKFIEFQDEAPRNYRFGPGAVSLPEQHQQYHDKKLVELRESLASINAKIISINEAMNNDSDPAVVLLSAGDDSDLLNQRLKRREVIYETRLLPLIFQYEELITRYGEDYPAIKSIKRQIALFEKMYPELKDQDLKALNQDELKPRVDSLLQILEQQKLTMMAEITEMEKLYTTEEEEARALAKFNAKDKKLQDEIERTSQLYESVITNLTQLDMLPKSDFEGFKFSRIGLPTPGEKVAPKAIKVMPISAILGLMCGFAIAYLLDVSDKAFRTPDEVARVMRLPLIGHIPLIDISKVKKLAGSTVESVIVTVHRPKSPQAEAYRAIRTALYFNARDEHHKILQVTSPMPGDGKSTLTMNLAVTIAQSGKSVLVLDADFRRPTLHKLFGLEKQKSGLTGVVRGETEPDECIMTFPEIPNLHFMPCGAKPSNPSELLSSQRFADTLEMFREKYDFILIDTPPILAVSDPCAVAARVDGVILTFRIHKRARPLAVRAREALNDIGANILGVVINGVDQEAGGYYSQYRYGFSGYRYAYNYRYGYGYGNYGTYGSERQEAEAISKYYADDKQLPTAATSETDAV